MTNITYENTALPDIVELRNIVQKYPDGINENTVLDGLCFLIEEKPGMGQINVVLGPSGCGKSTILRYIAGLQKPTSGEILLYAKPRTTDIHIPMVFQAYTPINELSVEENVALPLRIQRVKKEERLARITDIMKFCDLTKHMGKFTHQLSGGQLQRVAIARCLVANPHVLLMDEPFGALDIYTRQKVQDLLLAIQKAVKPTVIFITHDISEAVYLADDIHMMSANPGQIVDKVHIDLGSERTRETKKTPRFVEYVNYVDDKMMALQKS